MSNSSVTSYEVERNARLEAARREAALREIMALQKDLSGIRERARAAGVAAAPQPTRAETTLVSSSEAQSYLESLRSYAEVTQECIERALVARELQSIASIVRQVGARPPRKLQGVQATVQGVHATDSGRRVAPGPTVELMLEEIERIVAVDTIPAVALPELRRLADTATRTNEAQALLVLLVAMREKIASAQKHARERAAEARLAMQMLDDARGLVSPGLDDCRAQLEEVVAGKRHLPRELLATTASEIESARRRADREYVGAVLSEQLRALGYEVDSQVGTLFVEGGLLHIRRTDPRSEDDHAIELEVAPAEGRMSAHVLRVGDPLAPLTELQRKESARRQDQWCGHLADLVDALHRSDIAWRIDELIDPDGSSVAVVRKSELSARPRKRRQSGEVQRTMAARPGHGG